MNAEKLWKMQGWIRMIMMNFDEGQEECDEDLLEIITVYKSLKDPKIKGIALEQMKLLATIHPEH